MEKNEGEQYLDAASSSPQPALVNAAQRCPHGRLVERIASLRCIAALLFGVALLLSAAFWLPPFFPRDSGSRGFDHDPLFGAYAVASFRVEKPVSVVKANAAKLQYDIFNEIGVPNTTVAVISLEPFGANTTGVVFGLWPYPKDLNISTGLSILKSSFVSLVLRQSTLHLTTSLFGSAYFFQVLKFFGGITVVPPQIAFLLQEEHMLFNFTLNFPIYQVQGKVDELKHQMRLGLHLKTYEILFVKLTNTKGSTVEAPTVVEASVVLAVGNNQPSVPRLKQLAQNIRSSSAGNLGLNHTVFGRVKQIRLSSFLQRSLSSGLGSSMPPSPAPQPNTAYHRHHHSHHHRRRHHSDVRRASPAPSPNPVLTHLSPTPTGCHLGFCTNPKRKPEIVPIAAPLSNEVAPAFSLHLHTKSHLPGTSFTPARPPSDRVADIKPVEGAPSVSPSPASSSTSAAGLAKSHWLFAPLFAHLLSPL